MDQVYDAHSLSYHPYQIGPWYVQPVLNRITGPTGTATLEPRVMRILVLLAEQPGQVVRRDDLLDEVWAGLIVTENSLTNAVSDLRKFFEDDPRDPQVIETIRGVGYRLIAPVSVPGISDGHQGDGMPNVTPPESESHIRSNRRNVWTGGLVLACLIGLVWGGFSLLGSSQNTTPRRIVPLTSLPGPELNPVFSSDGQHLAFSWFDPSGKPADLYVKSLHSDAPVRLTDQVGAELSPTWSPDGQFITFLSNNGSGCGLYQVPALGGGARKLRDTTCRLSGLAWSPDGRRLAYSANDPETGARRIYLMDGTSYESIPVTDPPAHLTGDYEPVFSPDGTRLSFKRGLSVTTSDVYIMDLTARPYISTRLTKDNATVMGHDWTPDGREIVFASNRANTRGMWRISLDGGEPTLIRAISVDDPGALAVARQGQRLAYVDWDYQVNIWRSPGSVGPSAQILGSTRTDMHPHVSPGGDRLTFVSSRSGELEIWTSDIDGSRLMQLTQLNHHTTRAPRWSPDGNRIAFESRMKGQADVFVIDASGGVPVNITNQAPNDVLPSWSADGSALYFASDRSGNWQIWKHSIENGVSRQVTWNGGYKSQVSSDGRTLYFSKPDSTGIWSLDLPTGSEQKVAEGDAWHWDVTDQALYFITQKSRIIHFEVNRLDLETGSIREVTTLTTLPMASFSRWGFSVSRDESWIVYARVDKAESDIMLMEPFK